MTVLGDVFEGLNRMGLLQLLLAFVACIGYTLAQGSLVALRGRGIAIVTALGAALAFVVLSDAWAQSTVLIAIAVAGVGAFAAVAWVSGRLLGFAAAPVLPAEDPPVIELEPTVAPSPAHPRPRRRAAASSQASP